MENRLLQLPWDLRRAIIVEVLRQKREPCFSRKFIENRMRLRNCFDVNFPAKTNFYVPRHNEGYLPGNGLRATNHQLYDETNQVIRELESGNIHLPFILDVIIVKDIGVFPSWLSFPYLPQHLKLLTINIRIMRPGAATVPDEWVEAARYKVGNDPLYSPVEWNVIMAVVLYAFGWFSVKPGSIRPGVPRPNLADHQSDTIDTYLRSSAPYVTDSLMIHIKKREYDIHNKLIPPEIDDSRKKSRFYKKGHVQFGRDVFRDYSNEWKNEVEIEREERYISQGIYAWHHLYETLSDALTGGGFGLWGRTEPRNDPYLMLLAYTVGEVLHDGYESIPGPLLDRHPEDWVDIQNSLDPEGRGGAIYTQANLEQNLAREVASASPNSRTIAGFRTLLIRKSHGWVRDDD